jgi:hypothetical protein
MPGKLGRIDVASPGTMKQLLEVIAADDVGLARLIQALECLEYSLASRDDFHSFFDDVLKNWATSGKSWSSAWEEVARGIAPNRYGKRGHVRRTNMAATLAAPQGSFSTIVDEMVWRDWHVADNVEALVDAGLSIPSYPIGNDPARHDEFKALVTDRHWAEPASPDAGAWLGRPSLQNANCWVSSPRLSPTEPYEEHFGNAQDEVAARGMVATPNHASVQYWIDPGALTASAADDPAFGCRPGLADCGSLWFRAESVGPAAERHQRHGWGSTVNLDRIHDPGKDDTGLPERVIASIPVASPAVTKIELLPAASVTATGKRAPDAAGFLKRLKKGRTTTEILNEVVDALNITAPMLSSPPLP